MKITHLLSVVIFSAVLGCGEQSQSTVTNHGTKKPNPKPLPTPVTPYQPKLPPLPDMTACNAVKHWTNPYGAWCTLFKCTSSSAPYKISYPTSCY